VISQSATKIGARRNERNRRCEEEEEEEEKGFAFLNPNRTYDIGSIFNRGKKLFLASIQFHPRPNITLVAFLKYWPTF